MTKIKNPCGCTADDGKWLVLCIEHKAYHDQCTESSTLGAIERLIDYYEANKSPDNLHHVVERIKANASILTKSPAIVGWMVRNKSLLTGHRK